MRATDLEIGKVYSNERHTKTMSVQTWWWIARYNSTSVVCVYISPPSHAWIPFKTTQEIVFLVSDYDEVPDSLITPETKAKLADWMQKHGATTMLASKGCTCEINTLMISGCQCGWIQTERGKK